MKEKCECFCDQEQEMSTCACDDYGYDDASDVGVVEIGDQIPDVEMHVYHNGKDLTVNLSEYRGKWLVVFFYPADFTFVCPTELEDLADHYETFQKMDVEILSVSGDTVYTHKAWHDQSKAIAKVKYPMAGDPTRELMDTFGVYNWESGLARRGTFVVDPDGVLQAFEIHADGIGRSVDELLRKVQAAQFVREHGGEVCPAKWKPGEKTLTPSMDLVGKI